MARAEGPPALIDPSNPGAAAEAAGATVRAALSLAKVNPPVSSLWMGLAGAGRAGAREAVEIALRSQRLATLTRVGMDVEGAHQDAFGDGSGVLLAVGTGTMLWGRDPKGREFRVGGWGGLLGEEGSGYWLGLEGLRAVVRAADHRDPETLLSSVLLDALSLGDAQELVPWVAGASKREVGVLAPLVLRAAADGDAGAAAIRGRGIEALASHLTVAREAWDDAWDDAGGDVGASFPLAFAGGLLKEGGFLREAVGTIAEEMGAEISSAPVVPVRGAALLALRLAVSDPPDQGTQVSQKL